MRSFGEPANLVSSGENWRRHLDLLKLRTSADKLVFSVEDLSMYFADSEDPSNGVEVGAALDPGEAGYDDSKFYWKNIESLEVVSAVRRGGSDSEGRDGIPRSLLVRALPCILSVIVHIFGFCFAYGVFPDVWKSATICLIPKVKNPAQLKDYRPISILCSLSKVLEG